MVLPAVTAVQLHHSAMDTWDVCSFFVHTRREMAVLLQLLQYSCVTVIWIYGMTAMLFVQGERKWRVFQQLLQYSFIALQCIHGLNAVI